MNLSIKLQQEFNLSIPAMELIAELNGQHLHNIEYDWANQTTDFLVPAKKSDTVNINTLNTPLTNIILSEIETLYNNILLGNQSAIQQLLIDVQHVLIVGIPRTGGSYLTKELIKATGLSDHKLVNEFLAHDGYPDITPIWYNNTSFIHKSIMSLAEWLIISKFWYKAHTEANSSGKWIIPKKFHKMGYMAGSIKQWLGDNSIVIITRRHPVPTCISTIEKCGGWKRLDNNYFPPLNQQSAIERWITRDLFTLGYDSEQLKEMPYFEAFLKSYNLYHQTLVSSGINMRYNNIKTVSVTYSKENMERIANEFRTLCETDINNVEPFLDVEWRGKHPSWEQLSTDWDPLFSQGQ